MPKRKADSSEKGQTVLKRVRTIDDKVRKVDRRVAKIFRSIETNYVDTLVNINTAYDVNNVVHLSPITSDAASASGAPGTRQGSKVTPTSMELRLKMRQPSSTIQNPSIMRVIVIQSKQRFIPNTTAIGGTNAVLANQNSNAAVLAPFNKFNRRHFTVLYDETVVLGSWLTATGVSTSIDNTRVVTIKRKLSRDIAYEDASDTGEGGQIYLIAYSDIAAATTEPDLYGLCRIHYQDL